MKKLALAILLCSAASSAYAETATKVANDSGLPIDELFVAAPGTKNWSANLMNGVPEGALDSGKQIMVSGLDDGTFDLRISAPDEGVLCYMKDVVIKSHSVELTPEMGKACK
jgi:hypothetical protein